jgi:hypothetical protein
MTLTWLPFFTQCVMCFRTAAAQQAERSRVLNHGIVVLLIPPLLILAGVLLRATRRRSESPAPESQSDRDPEPASTHEP